MRLEEVYKRLELTGKGGFVVLSDSSWHEQVQMSERMLRLIKDVRCPLSQLSALFCLGGRPLLFFFDNPRNVAELHKTIWNLNEIPIVVVECRSVVTVYNGFAYEKELNTLSLLGGEDILGDLGYFKLVTGQGWEEYRERLAYHNRVDYYLLKNIEYAQKKIQQAAVSRNLANRLIGKVIFLRYLTDRHIVIDFEGQKRALTNEDLIELLQNKTRLARLFYSLQDKNTGFNGDLFKITEKELEMVSDEALGVLVRLLRSEDLESGETSLFDVYDFSILPVEFISNVYERFIGKENQEKKGAYYTPVFLVDYVIENTVAKHLDTSGVSGCKVLDPACGSGVFLVETLRCIIDYYVAHANAEELQGEKFQRSLKRLASDNIYGIDSDESAVQVAAFSIYLTLLDYLTPADVSTFRFPNLLKTNIICQDSFCDTPFEGMKFDYVIGNPPWKRGVKEYDESGREIEPEYKKYAKSRELAERCNIFNNNEIAQAFVLRSFDFMQPDTCCAFVLTSKILYNGQSCSFRSYLLNHARIDKVLELSSVRREVFSQSSDPAIAPACVIMYRKLSEGEHTDEHQIEHTALKPSVFFSLFKILTAEKADVQYVRQSLLKKFDFLWKVLMYGSYLDFEFILRLQGLVTIEKELKRLGYVYGQGIICGKENNRVNDIRCHIGKRKIEARDLRQYYVKTSDNVWTMPTAQRGRTRREIFKAPLLLVKKSLGSKDYSASAAVITTDAVYTDAITGVHGDDLNVLRNIAGLWNSRFFSYFALMSLSSVATEREQGHNKEKFSLPYIDGEIYRHVENIEKLCEESLSNMADDLKGKREEREKLEIEECIQKGLGMSKVEKVLVDYANNFSIPLAVGNDEGKPIRNDAEGRKFLSLYANVFIERFRGQFGENLYLNVECKISSSSVFMRFFVESMEEQVRFERGTMDDVEKFLLSFSTQHMSENLYLRKDVRGFEKDGFYIVKPAEKRLWHTAVAYVDVQEFVNSMLEVGINDVE